MSTMIGRPHGDQQMQDAMQDAVNWWERQMTQPLSGEALRASTRIRAQRHTAPRHLRAVRLQMARHLSPAFLLSYLLYVALNIGDLVSTWVGLHAGLREGNPLMSHLLFLHGFGALIAYKFIVVVAVGLGVGFLHRTYGRVALITLAVCNGLVGLAVLLNVVQTLMR